MSDAGRRRRREWRRRPAVVVVVQSAHLVPRFGGVGAVLFLFEQLEEVLGPRLQLLGLRLLAWIVRQDLCVGVCVGVGGREGAHKDKFKSNWNVRRCFFF